MTTETLTLTSFLIARIAEDEAMAQRCLPYVAAPGAEIQVSLSRTEGTRTITERVVPYDPARALATCDAWRAAAMIHTPKHPTWTPPDCPMCAEGWEDLTTGEAGHYPESYPCLTLRNLALPYADHPDYRDEWRA